jgi:hypothetical protein
MKQGIAFLGLWLVLALIASGIFILPTPPGGVEWPYHLVVASMPVAALLCARYTRRVFVVTSFGLIAGFLFAWLYFTDGRTHLRIEHGAITAESIALKIGGFTVLMPLVCAGAFALGRKILAHDETQTG